MGRLKKDFKKLTLAEELDKLLDHHCIKNKTNTLECITHSDCPSCILKKKEITMEKTLAKLIKEFNEDELFNMMCEWYDDPYQIINDLSEAICKEWPKIEKMELTDEIFKLRKEKKDLQNEIVKMRGKFLLDRTANRAAKIPIS
jgi:hypothetical protein